MDDKKGWRKLEFKKRSKKLHRHARKLESATTRHAHRFLVSRWNKVQEVRLNIVLWLVGVGVLIALVGLQMLWFQQSYIDRAPVRGGSYSEGIRGSIQSLNPLFAKSPAELAVSHLLFSQLYKTDATGRIKGDLAVSMKNISDRVFTVKLRQDAVWHDGQRVTASDVVFTVGLMKDESSHAIMNSSWQKIGIEEVDDYTVRFVLPVAYAAFPQALTFSVLPRHILKDIKPADVQESSFSKSPVGSGPFALRLLQSVGANDNRKIVHLDANPAFYDGKPRLSKLLVHAYPNEDDLLRALKTNEVNGASDVTSTTARELAKSRYETVVKPVNSGVYAIFNTVQPGLNDVKVRRAIQGVTDTASVRAHVYGNPHALSLPFITRQVSGANELRKPELTVADAAKLLDDAGWRLKDGVRTDKDNNQLRLKVVTRKTSNFEGVIKELASQWRRLGIQVDTRVVDTSDPTQNYVTEVLSQRNYDVLIDEMVIGGDPDVYAYWHSKGQQNLAGYSNEVSDDDLSSARTTSDQVLRSVKYISFAKHWLQDAPAIGLYQSNYIYMHTKNTRTIDPDEVIISADQHYANVLYWTAKNDTVYKTP